MSAAKLTRQLLTFSRKQAIKPKVINVNAMVDESQKMLRRLIGEDIEIILSQRANFGTVKIDQSQMEQILVNLVVNARDAMPDGGHLTLETADVTLDEEYCEKHAYMKAGDYVMLSVLDDGVGIEEEALDQIFEPFFTTKERGKGTGLGLATIYGIVKQNEGTIEVQSEIGKGTVFKVYLPRVADEPEDEKESVLREIVPTGTATILVVEDERLVREVAVRLLRRQGYRVFQASSGPEALAFMERRGGDVDLVLIDVIMPEWNGRECADRLRERFPEIRVLYTSGYAESTIFSHGVLDPEIDFIRKPFNPRSLATKVKEVLERKPANDRGHSRELQ